MFQTVDTVKVTLGGISAPVVYSGLAPGAVALYQVNVQIPAGAPTGSTVPVVLTVTNPQDGTTAAQSNTVTVALQQRLNAAASILRHRGWRADRGSKFVFRL